MADRPSALLWDFDGTTVASEQCWARAETRLLAHLGGARPGVDIPRQDGASLDGTLRWIHEVAGVPLVDRDGERRELNLLAVEEYHRDGPVPLPGVRELLVSAHAAGIANLLVSANETWVLRQVLAGLDGLDYAHLVGEDMVALSKPAPDLYLEACRIIGADPRDCIAFEDSVNGATAAVAAGCFTVGVTGSATEAVHGMGLRLDGLSALSLGDLVVAWRSWR